MTKSKSITTKQKSQQVTKHSDIRYREYWRNNERFADLFNTVVFGSESRVLPEHLHEVDTRASRLVPIPELEYGIERTRDVMKVCKGVRYLLLGVENQKHVHYGMPLRTLTYDVLGYIDEAKQISKRRKKEHGLTSEEFLSGMRKEDKLTPIITIVIYYGEEPWDGPLTLSEMFEKDVQQDGLNQTEHHMTLLQVSESEQYHFQNEETETIFSISRDLFQGNIDKVKEKYSAQDLSCEIIAMIGNITGIKGMKQIAEEGEENMCKAMDALFEQERIKTEEKTCKAMQALFEQERIKTEEKTRQAMRALFEQEQMEADAKTRQAMRALFEQEQMEADAKGKAEIAKERSTGIETLIQVLTEFHCEISEVYQRVNEKYHLSAEEAERCFPSVI